MKKTLIFFLIIGFLGSLTFGASTVVAKPEKVKLMVAAFPMNYSWYPPTVALNDLIMRHTDLDITVQSMGGSLAMPGPVEKGEADILGCLTVPTQAGAYFGVGDFKGNPHRSLRLLIVMGQLPQTYLTVGATGINNVPDLKGRRVGKAVTMTQDMPEAILRAYGFDLEKDFQWAKYGSSNDMYKDLALGRIHAFYDSITGAKIIKLKEQSRSDVVLLSTGEAQFKKAAALDPDAFIGTYWGEIPIAQIPGAARPDLVGCSIRAMGIGANKNLPVDVAYTYVKTLIEHQEDLRKTQARLKNFSSKIAVPIPAFPYHPGAVKFYKEKGLWTDAHEKAQQDLLK